MFSGLIKFVYWEYLNYLRKLFGNHPYVKARFYTKCGISKRVAQFAQEVFNEHPIQNKMLLKDPQDLNLNESIGDLQLQLSTDYNGPKVINTRIKKLDVHYDEVDYDPQLLSFFPNVEVVKFDGWMKSNSIPPLHLEHLSNLKFLELDYPCNKDYLPTSLVKLVVRGYDIGDPNVDDLSYLTSLKELVLLSDLALNGLSERLLQGEIHLPQSINRLEVYLGNSVNIEVQLPNLKELIIHYNVPTNITEHNFPSLKFIQLIKLGEDALENATNFLSPTELFHNNLINSVKLVKNEYLFQLFCFPWWIQYPSSRQLINSCGEIVADGELLAECCTI
ncbi:hypothetical protein P9112_006087 [Eukaryota sp. TZLM1-RC]